MNKELCIIGILIIMLLSYFRDRDLRSPRVIYCAFWTIILGLYSLRLYGLYSTEVRPYIYIFISCLMFSLGGVFHYIFKIGRNYIEHCFSHKIIFCLFVFSALFFLRQNVVTVIGLIKGGTIFDLRYAEVHATSYLEDVLVKFVARPFTTALICISLAELVSKEKAYRKHLVMAMILSIQSMLFDGAMVLFEILATSLAIAFLLMLIDKNQDGYLKQYIKNRKKTIVIVGIIALGGLFIAKGSIFKTVYMHFTPSVIYLNERLETIDIGRNTDLMRYTYGLSTLQGIVRPIMAVFDKMGISSPLFDSATEFLLDNHEFVINIAEGEYFNFYTTSIAFYYKDFGILGVFLLPTLHGFLCSQLYMRMKEDYSTYNLTLYIMMTASILLLTKCSFWASTEFIVALYWLFVCRRKREGLYVFSDSC